MAGRSLLILAMLLLAGAASAAPASALPNVVLSVSPTSATVGPSTANLVQVTARNAGDAEATDVRIYLQGNASIEYGQTRASGGDCPMHTQDSPQQVMCKIGTIPAGEERSVVFRIIAGKLPTETSLRFFGSVANAPSASPEVLLPFKIVEGAGTTANEKPVVKIDEVSLTVSPKRGYVAEVRLRLTEPSTVAFRFIRTYGGYEEVETDPCSSKIPKGKKTNCTYTKMLGSEITKFKKKALKEGTHNLEFKVPFECFPGPSNKRFDVGPVEIKGCGGLMSLRAQATDLQGLKGALVFSKPIKKVAASIS